jgi:hypothetical protein
LVFSRSVRGDVGPVPELMSDRCVEETLVYRVRDAAIRRLARTST